ncbi:MAG: bile acid:sodium symporter family protein [Verrucomicrobiota bacterium]|nr:bile acid:sodium symporter family protein [Verrucomicrobiota bacterium]
MFWKSLADGATKLFPLWSLLVGVIALYNPEFFLWYGKDTISLGLGIIMLGMGLTLTVNDFSEVLQKPKLVAMGAFLQFSIMPAWAALISYIIQIPAEMAVGLILVASCPGGTASNVVVFLAKGRVALSVCLTACSTLLAIGVTPWLTHFYAGHYLPVDPWALMKSIFYIVLIPLIAGVSWKKFYPDSARRASTFSPLLSVLFILLIVGFVLAAKKEIILEHWQTMLISVLLLHLGGFFLGFLIPRLIQEDKSVCRTISIEVGMQNSGLGMALASKHFSTMPMVPAPCALSAVMHCIIGSLLAAFWQYEKRASKVV